MHVHKIGQTTLIVWVLGRIEKGSRNEKIFFFVLNKYQCVTHVSTCIVQGLFKTIILALVTKKVIGNFSFFHRPDFFPPCTLPYKLKEIFLTKKSFKLLFMKSHTILR